MKTKQKNENDFAHYLLLGLLEPVVFIASLDISCVILLHGIGSNYSKIFEFLKTANEQVAVSDSLAVFIPVSIIAVLTVLISFTRKNASSIVKRIRTPYQFAQIVICIFLIGFLVLCVLEFGQAFRTPTSLADDQLANIRWLIVATLGLSIVSLTLCKLDEAFFDYFNFVEIMPDQQIGEGNLLIKQQGNDENG